MKFTIAALALLLPAQALAQYDNRTFYGPNGNVAGSSTTSSSGQVTFYNNKGGVAGRAFTDSQGTTTFYDDKGRIAGSVTNPNPSKRKP